MLHLLVAASNSCLLVLSQLNGGLPFLENTPCGSHLKWMATILDLRSGQWSWHGSLISRLATKKVCREHKLHPCIWTTPIHLSVHVLELSPPEGRTILCCLLTLTDRYTTHINCLSTSIMMQSGAPECELRAKTVHPWVTSSSGWNKLQDSHEKRTSLAFPGVAVEKANLE